MCHADEDPAAACRRSRADGTRFPVCGAWNRSVFDLAASAGSVGLDRRFSAGPYDLECAEPDQRGLPGDLEDVCDRCGEGGGGVRARWQAVQAELGHLVEGDVLEPPAG